MEKGLLEGYKVHVTAHVKPEAQQMKGMCCDVAYCKTILLDKTRTIVQKAKSCSALFARAIF